MIYAHLCNMLYSSKDLLKNVMKDKLKLKAKTAKHSLKIYYIFSCKIEEINWRVLIDSVDMISLEKHGQNRAIGELNQ